MERTDTRQRENGQHYWNLTVYIASCESRLQQNAMAEWKVPSSKSPLMYKDYVYVVHQAGPSFRQSRDITS